MTIILIILYRLVLLPFAILGRPLNVQFPNILIAKYEIIDVYFHPILFRMQIQWSGLIRNEIKQGQALHKAGMDHKRAADRQTFKQKTDKEIKYNQKMGCIIEKRERKSTFMQDT